MSDSEQQDEGQVSEVSGLKKEGELSEVPDVSDGDSVAGQPTRESGATDEGPQGPDAPTFSEDRDDYSDKDDVETTG